VQTPIRHALNPVFEHLRNVYGAGAVVSLETFVDAALYAPGIGYYRRKRERVGYGPGHDFYTAESLGGVFRELVLEAVESLLPTTAAAYTLVELGAEPGGGLVAGRRHPFAAERAVRPGEDPRLAGPTIVFSNELFDAQPFRRFVVEGGVWRESGVQLRDRHAEAVLRPPFRPLPRGLPEPPAEGYCYDYPSGAEDLLGHLLAAPWHGLFLAFDYGLDADTLATERPRGTARSYFEHTQSADLLADPGERDLTHHVCWDHLEGALEGAGFEGRALQTQEAFFMHHATPAIARILARATEAPFDPDRQTLKELLHPHHFGRKFQVLRGFRRENACQAKPGG
jgi:SAM-dependent MidA family methyltransferase